MKDELNKLTMECESDRAYLIKRYNMSEKDCIELHGLDELHELKFLVDRAIARLSEA